jgi:hypothetical protein
MKRTLVLLAAAGCALSAMAAPSFARTVTGPTASGYENRFSAVVPRFDNETPYNPDGSYKSQSAYEHSIFGTPCGMECDE